MVLGAFEATRSLGVQKECTSCCFARWHPDWIHVSHTSPVQAPPAVATHASHVLVRPIKDVLHRKSRRQGGSLPLPCIEIHGSRLTFGQGSNSEALQLSVVEGVLKGFFIGELKYLCTHWMSGCARYSTTATGGTGWKLDESISRLDSTYWGQVHYQIRFSQCDFPLLVV